MFQITGAEPWSSLMPAAAVDRDTDCSADAARPVLQVLWPVFEVRGGGIVGIDGRKTDPARIAGKDADRSGGDGALGQAVQDIGTAGVEDDVVAGGG
jgi:hypothetical protein